MRVFILGAGASIHAGYPSAAEMGNRLADWINSLPVDSVYHYYLDQVVNLYGALDNFETVLTDLMTCPSGSRAATLGAMRPLLLDSLQEAIRDYFNVIRSGSAPLYDELANLLLPGDTIITFNYDLGIERALRTTWLWDIQRGYGFSIDNGKALSPVEILKLHGSTNWRKLYFGGMTGESFAIDRNSLGDRPVLSDLEYLGYRDQDDPRSSRLVVAPNSPAMILPALPKRFYVDTQFGREWEPFWAWLWQRAKCAIGRADELVVIGYSLPIADECARDMLLNTENKAVRLSICCRKDTTTLEQEFRDHGFSRIQDVGCTFENFLKVAH